MAKTVSKKVEKKEFTLQQVFAMWKETSKEGNEYFSGKAQEGRLVGFYNTNKQNPKEPDIRIYLVDDEGNRSKDEYISLWCNVTEKGKKYLSGKLNDQRVVGFINSKSTKKNKQPYFSVYFSNNDKPEEAKEE